MNIPDFRFDEMDLEKIAENLTWYDFDHKALAAMEDKKPLPGGTLLRLPGYIALVGDATGDGYDYGCGCCADREKFTQVAFLSELLGELT